MRFDHIDEAVEAMDFHSQKLRLYLDRVGEPRQEVSIEAFLSLIIQLCSTLPSSFTKFLTTRPLVVRNYRGWRRICSMTREVEALAADCNPKIWIGKRRFVLSASASFSSESKATGERGRGINKTMEQ
jgi:hypothetical protein